MLNFQGFQWDFGASVDLNLSAQTQFHSRLALIVLEIDVVADDDIPINHVPFLIFFDITHAKHERR